MNKYIYCIAHTKNSQLYQMYYICLMQLKYKQCNFLTHFTL